MNFLKVLLIISICVICFSGCNILGHRVRGPGSVSSPPKKHKQGPPPHAPAHGYRHKHHHGHELTYDKKIGAYIVVNTPDIYFGNNLFIRLSSYGQWMVSSVLGGDWRLAGDDEVPYKLKEHKKKKKKNKKGKSKKHKKGKKT